MKEHHLPVQRTARYYTLGTPSAATRQLWLVCHGYGQQARFFLRHFKVLEAEDTVVVAPEALSRFYLNGSSGRVGATWMTKEDRLTEITDYVHYLDTLLLHLLQDLPAEVKITVLGFSQGGATVCRWVAQGQVRCHRLILWAASFPEDIAYTTGKAAFAGLPVATVHGLQDEYITPEKWQQQARLLGQLGIQPEVYTFTGGHTIDGDTLLKLKRNLG